MTTQLFQFEASFADSLHCIPMVVRLKLDTCGIKLKLTQWNHLSSEERKVLLSLPCDTEQDCDRFRSFLTTLLQEKLGEPAKSLAIDPHPPWLALDRIPNTVQAQAQNCDRHLTLAQWQTLSPLQRFALIKLSQSNHENRNFLPALLEFGLDG
jgi:hypothetical protein